MRAAVSKLKILVNTQTNYVVNFCPYSKMNYQLQTCLEKTLVKFTEVTLKKLMVNNSYKMKFYIFVAADMETGVYRWLTPDHSYGLLTGGMTYNATTGHLRISKNGTYYMYSTVRFWRDKNLEHDVTDLTVDIKITSYCNSAHLGNLYRNTGFNPKHYVIIPKGGRGGSYSAHTSGIARLCKNDYIYLHIHGMPSHVVISSSGSASTNFGAFMIAPNCQEQVVVPVTPTTNEPMTSTTQTEPRSSPTPPNRCERRSQCE